MNKIRYKMRAKAAFEDLEDLMKDLEGIRKEAAQCYISLPDEIQNSESGEDVQRNIQTLGETLGYLENAYSALIQLV